MYGESEALMQRLQALQQVSAQPIMMGLERVEALCARLGHPEKRLPPVIHIAGTNGKGSLGAFLQALAEMSGFEAHRYISPHLVRFNERILLHGKEIDDTRLLACLDAVLSAAQELGATYFESTTVAAYLAFADIPADLLILETGMGGRLDATNVVSPILTAITPISYDHQAFLGDSIEAIAGEKAGILKPGVPCVIGPQVPGALDVLRRHVREKQCPVHVYERHWRVEPEDEGFTYISDQCWLDGLKPSLAGEHQYVNAGMAIACIEMLEERWAFSEHAIREGLAKALWPARLQRLEGGRWAAMLPEGVSLWLDGGHNEGAARILRTWMAKRKRPVHIICGMLQDKDHDAFLEIIGERAASMQCLAIPGTDNSATAEALLSAAQKSKVAAEKAESLPSALQFLSKQQPAPYDVLICGSLYLAGYVLHGDGLTEG